MTEYPVWSETNSKFWTRLSDFAPAITRAMSSMACASAGSVRTGRRLTKAGHRLPSRGIGADANERPDIFRIKADDWPS